MRSSFEGFEPKQIKEAKEKLEQTLENVQEYSKQVEKYKEGVLKSSIWTKLKDTLF